MKELKQHKKNLELQYKALINNRNLIEESRRKLECKVKEIDEQIIEVRGALRYVSQQIKLKP